MRTRAELVRLQLAHEAAAQAIKDEINRRAAEAWSEGSADTWRLELATVSASISHSAAQIVSADDFLKWLHERRPDAVRVETITRYTPYNPKWVMEDFLPSMEPVDAEELDPGGATGLYDPETGEVIPGVVWKAGGMFISASIRPGRGVKRHLAELAKQYAEDEGRPWPL